MNVTSTAPLVSPIKRTFVNASSLGSTEVVAAVAGGKIRVFSVAAVAGGAVSLKFQSAATDISATMALAANGGFVLPFNEHGWFETAVGEALNVNLSAAVAVGVQIQYQVM